MTNSLIDSITSPLKAAGDIANGLINLRDTVKFGEAVISLQAQIMSAQQGALAAKRQETQMGAEIRTLKQRLADMDDWKAQQERYQLEKLPPGVFVYTLKPDKADGEPPHQICQTCYQRSKKSILHAHEASGGTQNLECHECKTMVLVGENRDLSLHRPKGSWMAT
jgi:hypothetical protein